MLFSVVIPTLNRASTLRCCLETCRQQVFGDVEYIVSDNCSDDETTNVIQTIASTDKRFVSLCAPARLAMSSHWECALAHAKGRYVAFLGDDDGLVPDSLNISARLLQELDYPKALTSYNLDYHWPDSMVPHHANLSRIPLGRSHLRKNCHDTLLALGRGDEHYNLCPMLYRGWVSSDSIAALRRRAGKVFLASSPDVYAAVALCAIIDSFVLTEIPLFIIGASSHSTGAKSYHGTREHDKEFWVEDSIPFHPEVPRCAATSILVQEALLQCKDAGLISESMLMDWQVLVAKAAHECAYLSAERFVECLHAIEIIAERRQVAFDSTEAQSRFTSHAQVGSPFPTRLAWNEKWIERADALAFRTDAWGIRDLTDFYELLRAKASPHCFVPRSVAQMADLYSQLDMSQLENRRLTAANEAQRGALRHELESTRSALRQTQHELETTKDALGQMQGHLGRIKRSPFWRLTWPLRLLNRAILRFYRRVRQ